MELNGLHTALGKYGTFRAANQEKIIEGVKLNLDRLKQRSDRLTDAYLDDVLDKTAFEERRSTLVMETRKVQEKLEELQSDAGAIPRKMANFLEHAKSLHSSYISAIPLEKRQLLNELTSNRSLSGKSLEITLREPYLTLANRGNLSLCGDQRDGPRTEKTDQIDFLFRSLLQHFETSSTVSKDVIL